MTHQNRIRCRCLFCAVWQSVPFEKGPPKKGFSSLHKWQMIPTASHTPKIEREVMESSNEDGKFLVVGEPKEEEVKEKKMKVLVALDESEGSFNALNWALDTLFGRDGDRAFGSLVIVHAMQPLHQHFFPGGPGVYVAPVVVDSVRQCREQNAATLLARASVLCNEKHATAETVSIEGEPKEVICGVAEQMDADLVVVGSRGLGRIKRAFLGSVSDYVAHHAKCPVLIVKPHK